MRASGGRLCAPIVLALLALVGPAWAATAPRPRVVTVDVETDGGPLGRLVGEERGRVAYFGLDDLARLVGGRVGRAANGRQARLQFAHGTVDLTRDRAEVTAGGRAVTLSAPVRVERGRWLVPGDLIVRGLPPALGRGVRVATARSGTGGAAHAAQGVRVPTPRGTPAPAFLALAPSAPPIAAVALGPARAGPLEGILATPGPSVVAPGAGAPPSVASAGPVTTAVSGVPPPPAAPQAPSPPPAPPPTPGVPAPAAVVPKLPLAKPAGHPGIAPGAGESAPREPSSRETAPREATREAVGRASGSSDDAAGELRYRSYPTYTRIVIEGETATEPRLVETAGGLMVTLPGFSHRGPPAGRAVRDGLVGGLELATDRGGATLRVTFDRTPATRRVYRLEDPARLVLDFYRSGLPGKGAASPGASGPAAEGLRVIVIDPGHGGHDPGAKGPSGLQEKELTLDVARRVAALLQEEPGVRVLLTRSGDRFVALRERTAFANRERADLFVSIHVNSAPATEATGTETYFLSSEATDNAARQAAAAENRVVALEGSAKGAPRDMLRSILWDLAQSDFQQQSSRLAEVVQNTLDRALRLPSRGVKQAPFYVLGGAAMPAILVEIGFLTNPTEEQRLRDDGYRDRIARAIAAGLGAYKQGYDRRAGPVARR